LFKPQQTLYGKIKQISDLLTERNVCMSFLKRKPPKLSKEATENFRKLLIKDYLSRFGGVQVCSSCGFVLSYQDHLSQQICCGKGMTISKNNKEKGE